MVQTRLVIAQTVTYCKIESASIFYTLSIAVGSQTSAKSVAGLTSQLTYDP